MLSSRVKEVSNPEWSWPWILYSETVWRAGQDARLYQKLEICPERQISHGWYWGPPPVDYLEKNVSYSSFKIDLRLVEELVPRTIHRTKTLVNAIGLTWLLVDLVQIHGVYRMLTWVPASRARHLQMGTRTDRPRIIHRDDDSWKIFWKVINSGLKFVAQLRIN